MPEIVVGDVELHFKDQGRGPILLLVHGFPLDHSMWAGQIAGLSDQFRVIAPDLPGFGQSSVRLAPAAMEWLADDLVGLLDALEIDQPVALCGLSMGGYVAWQFWRRHAERLDRLILCDTRAAADTEDARQARLDNAEQVLREGPSALVEGMIPKLFATDTLESKPDFVAATRQVMLNTDIHGIAAALRGMADRTDFTDSLSEIQLPTLVICGQQDVLSPVAEMQQIADAIPGAEFREIPYAGHMSPLEQPEKVNAAIREFVR